MRRRLIILGLILLVAAGCGRKAAPPGDRALLEGDAPRLIFFEQSTDNRLRLELNRPLTEAGVSVVENYIIEGPGEPRVVLARREPRNEKVIILDVVGLEPDERYVLFARNLRSEVGVVETLQRSFIARTLADERPPQSVFRRPTVQAPDRPAIQLRFDEAVRPGPEFVAEVAEILSPPPVEDGEGDDDGETEPPEETAAETELGPPISLEARFDGDTLHLSSPVALEGGARYQVRVAGVLDLAGNVAEEESWTFNVREAGEGEGLVVRLRTGDGTELPEGLELVLAAGSAGEEAVARLRPREPEVVIEGLEPTPARRSPYLLVEAPGEGYRYYGFYDEDGDGRPDRLGTLTAGARRSVDVVLRREDVAGPELTLEHAPHQTAGFLGLVVRAVDQSDVERIEAFLDLPGADGTGKAFVGDPRSGPLRSRETEAYLALPTGDWPAGTSRVLYYHARDALGNWSPLHRVELSRPDETPTFEGLLHGAGEPVADALVLLRDAEGGLLALGASDEAGRFSLPRLDSDGLELSAFAPRRDATWFAVLEHLDQHAYADGGTIELELHPYPRLQTLQTGLIRYQPLAGAAVPEDYLSVWGRAVTPEGYRFDYELELDGTRQPLPPPRGGALSAHLGSAGLDELAEPPRLILTPYRLYRGDEEEGLEPSHPSLAIEAGTLTPLPFTSLVVTVHDRRLRIAWDAVEGAAGYRLVVIPLRSFTEDTEEELERGGVWHSGDEPLRRTELSVAVEDIRDYWGMPAGTRYVVALAALGADGVDTAWSFGVFIRP